MHPGEASRLLHTAAEAGVADHALKEPPSIHKRPSRDKPAQPLPADDELWDVENLLITPHMAGGTQFERQHVLDIFYENLGRFVRGELPLRNQIDKVRGF